MFDYFFVQMYTCTYVKKQDKLPTRSRLVATSSVSMFSLLPADVKELEPIPVVEIVV